MTEASVTCNQQKEEEDSTTTKSANGVSTVIECTVPKETENVMIKRDIRREKLNLNLIFGGHVDAGKSTICAKLL